MYCCQHVPSWLIGFPCFVESGITVMIQTSVRRIARSEIRLRLVFDLSATYPSCLPNISVSSEELTRAQCKELRDKLLGQARECLSEPMIHDLVLWTQQNCNSLIGNSLQDETSPLSAVTDDGAWTTLLHLDHMRAKSKYVKTLEKWTSDLKLTGKLMFMGKMILILLQGDKRNIRVSAKVNSLCLYLYAMIKKIYKNNNLKYRTRCKKDLGVSWWSVVFFPFLV
ncbi:hypothetical protein GDO78_018407 [Eleutherodactylus coqui]|uniref:RWD domain-containing protein 3 n=1 Tax=Eleutherodactylus coqui TaxID=57060 RepID=A0A8J6BJ80_ELECQ|nr:hypothetical protein GDO78_018407 [Eleutherodactylus coqui]